MWSNLLKLLTILFFNRQLLSLKNNLLNLRENVADYTEDRAQLIKQDFIEETERLASSLVGLLVVFSMLIFTGLLGLMWLFSILWDNPHRSLILGLVMAVPIIIGIGLSFAVHRLWKQKPLFANSLELISHDWQVFRNQTTPKNESTSSTDTAAPTNAQESGNADEKHSTS